MEKTVTCKQCGTEAIPDAHYCMVCGSQVDSYDSKKKSSDRPTLSGLSDAPQVSTRHADAVLSPIDADEFFADISSEAPRSSGGAEQSQAELQLGARPIGGAQRMAELSREQIMKRLERERSFSREDLRGANLSGLSLEGVDFTRADLDGANLEGAQLRGAIFKNASLRQADLRGADLSGANLEKADLQSANLEGARLDGAKLKRASLEGAVFLGASMVQARLVGSELVGANFRQANLMRADLSYGDLTKAQLAGANLEEADLSNATLHAASLEQAILDGAELADAELFETDASGASFRGASMQHCNLDGANLKSADLSEVDARHASFSQAVLDNTLLTGAHLANINAAAAKIGPLLAEWIDISPHNAQVERLAGEAVLEFIKTGGTTQVSTTRYFGRGDVLRDADLKFGDNALVHIDSRFENCSITLGEGTQLTIGESGVLKHCKVSGSGNMTVHGRFLEGQSPGITGAKRIVVSARGGIAGTVQQASQPTLFAFEPGCRLRVKVKALQALAAE